MLSFIGWGKAQRVGLLHAKFPLKQCVRTVLVSHLDCTLFSTEFHSEKTHQMFSVHTQQKFKNTKQSPVILNLCLKNLDQGNHRIIVTPSFRKVPPFSKCFLSTQKRIAGAFKFLCLEERFQKKLRFLSKLRWRNRSYWICI